MKELNEEKIGFITDCLDLFAQCTGNTVTLPDGEKLTIFEQPLIGFGSAEIVIRQNLFRRSIQYRSRYLSRSGS